MKIALDTNRYTDFANGDRDALGVVTRADDVYMPVIVLGELRSGFLMGNRPDVNEQFLSQFLAEPNVHVLSADEATSTVYAQLAADLSKRQLPIPTNDMWIAALAIQHSIVLYSRDPHFKRVTNLALL